MWGYQEHFRIGVRVAAEAVFGKLDQRIIPSVFLVGVLAEDREDRHPICLEPEDCGVPVHAFEDINKIAEQNIRLDPERLIIHSHPIAEKQHRRRIEIGSLRKAIESIIDSYSVFDERATRVSWPVNVEGYLVFVILQFENDAFIRHYSLHNATIDGRYRKPISLIEETVTEFLGACSKALHMPEPGSGLGIVGDHDGVIKAAGESLIHTPAYAGGNMSGLGGLFGTCNVISNMRYEREEGTGSIAFVRRDHPNIEQVVEFTSPVRMKNQRAVRKLLELSSGEMFLLSDSFEIYGVGRLRGNYDHRREDLFTIEFSSGSVWELLHDGHSLMQVAFGQPRLRLPSVRLNLFLDVLRRILGDFNEKKIRHLWELVEAASEQSHGALLVISQDADQEASRLESQSISVKPIALTRKLVQAFTSIDGALLVDHLGVCHAIGLILDGRATSKGDPSRGSRYNSAQRYIESVSVPSVAIVVSVDGSIDILPNLRPRISRAGVQAKIDEIRELAESEEPDVGNYNRVLSWLSDRRFYLLPEMCEEINVTKWKLDELPREHMEVRLVIDDFAPNPEMNDSYFLD